MKSGPLSTPPGLVTAAQAAVILATAPAPASFPTGQAIACNLVNLNSKTETIFIEVMDMFGAAVTTFPGVGDTFSLLPSNGVTFRTTHPSAAWCRFTVSGSKTKWRGAAVYDNGTEYVTAIPATAN